MMRSGRTWVTVAGVVAGLCGPAGASGQAAQSEWQQRAESLVRDLEGGRFGEATETMAPEVRTQLDSARLASVWAQITAASGALKTLTQRSEAMQEGLHVIEMDAAFERQVLVVRVVLGDDGLVRGLWFLPPGGGEPGAGGPAPGGPRAGLT